VLLPDTVEVTGSDGALIAENGLTVISCAAVVRRAGDCGDGHG